MFLRGDSTCSTIWFHKDMKSTPTGRLSASDLDHGKGKATFQACARWHMNASFSQARPDLISLSHTRLIRNSKSVDTSSQYARGILQSAHREAMGVA